MLTDTPEWATPFNLAGQSRPDGKRLLSRCCAKPWQCAHGYRMNWQFQVGGIAGPV
jgi:hypothetical protein